MQVAQGRANALNSQQNERFGANELQKGNPMTKSRWSCLMIALVAVVAVGCSDGARRLSPVGPSPQSEAPSSTATATAASWASANGWSTMADGRVAVADGVSVEAIDVVGDVSGACPSRIISVRGVPVAVTASTSFVAPLSCASLTPGKAVKITGVLLHSGSVVNVIATQLALVGDEASKAPASTNRGGEKLSGEGVVGAVSGGCPSVSFVILGYRVQATETTVYENGDCNGVREGAQVHLDVDRQPDGAIFAERIVILRASGRRE